MLLIPWKYLKNCLVSLSLNATEVGEKLTAQGLETNLVYQGENIYLEFAPLPNRPDLLSWWGMVREIGILLNCHTSLPFFPEKPCQEKNFGQLKIATGNCSEFHLGLVKKITVKESSPIIKSWLAINNIRPSNNVVDIANLVRLETGQAFHLFDYDSLLMEEKNSIIVRQADKNEQIISSTNQELILMPTDIVISAGRKIIALAGIVEAKNNAITFHTQNLLIGCASLATNVLRNTTSRLNIANPSSHFFHREVNLTEQPLVTLHYLLSRLAEISQEQEKMPIISTYHKSKKKKKNFIAISENFIKKKIGHLVPSSQLAEIWKKLNFSWQKKKSTYYLTPPSYRSDIKRAEDLCEEILRIYDYNQIPSSLPIWQKNIINNGDKWSWEKKRKIGTFLANNGWQEIITYSLVSEPERRDFAFLSNSNFYQVLLPKSENHYYYRQNLVPSHLKVINYNQDHGNKNLLLFEISSLYIPNSKGKSLSEELLTLSAKGKIFQQPVHHLIQEVNLTWIKGILENIFALCLIAEKVTFCPTSYQVFNQEIKAKLFLGEENIGFLGFGKDNKKGELIFFAQISLTKIFNFLINYPPRLAYQPVSNFPKSEKDLSFVFPITIDHAEVIKTIKSSGGEDLREVNVFDVYQSKELANRAKKSVSFRLVFQSSTKTLEKKTIEKKIEQISQKIVKLFQAEARK